MYGFKYKEVNRDIPDYIDTCIVDTIHIHIFGCARKPKLCFKSHLLSLWTDSVRPIFVQEVLTEILVLLAERQYIVHI